MDLDQDTIKKIRGLILFTIVAAVAGFHYKELFLFAAAFIRMIQPFLFGAAIAFILNVPMRCIERILGRSGKLERGKRPASLILAILFVVGILFLVTFVVLPQLVKTAVTIQKGIPAFLNSLMSQLEVLFANNPQILYMLEGVELDWHEISMEIMSFLKNGAGSLLNTTFSAAMSIVNGFSTLAIAFIFAVYILLQKETLGRQYKKLLYAFLPEQAVKGIIGIGRLTEHTFSSFLAGQCLEAVILGSMFFVTLTLLRLPYALLIGVLIAFTALIPIFGAFIGLGIGVFLMLMVSPMDALIFAAVFFVLQQIEGNLIYPHVVGNSVGLPAIWVLVAVTVGASMMGIVGMLIFIPLCSVLYTLLRSIVNLRLQEKGAEASE